MRLPQAVQRVDQKTIHIKTTLVTKWRAAFSNTNLHQLGQVGCRRLAARIGHPQDDILYAIGGHRPVDQHKILAMQLVDTVDRLLPADLLRKRETCDLRRDAAA